jgi:regulatory protein YycI of two-component signal transduction system YycFG
MKEEQLTGVYRNNAGDIISFLTSEGRVISYRKALMEVEEGTLSVVNIEETDATEPSISFESTFVDQLPELY